MTADEIQYDALTDSQQRLVVRTNLIQLNTDARRFKDTLYDGTPKELPLVERVRNIETYVDFQKFWFRTIAVAIVLQTITFGVAAIMYFARLYPLLEKLANQP